MATKLYTVSILTNSFDPYQNGTDTKENKESHGSKGICLVDRKRTVGSI